MLRAAFGGVARDAGKAQEREHIHVVPFERDREGDHVEIADRRLRLERQDRRPGRGQLRKLLLGRKKKPFADDVRFSVEQPVDRLEAEVGHADPVGVRKGERDSQAITVRFADEADFFGEDVPCAFALCPGFHSTAPRRTRRSAR